MNPNTSSAQAKRLQAFDAQERLTQELNRLHDLVGTSRLALQQVAAIETVCIEGVLTQAETDLYQLWEAQNETLTALKSAAYDQTPAEALHEARATKARIVARLADNLQSQMDAICPPANAPHNEQTTVKTDDLLLLADTIKQLYDLHQEGIAGGAA